MLGNVGEHIRHHVDPLGRRQITQGIGMLIGIVTQRMHQFTDAFADVDFVTSFGDGSERSDVMYDVIAPLFSDFVQSSH